MERLTSDGLSDGSRHLLLSVIGKINDVPLFNASVGFVEFDNVGSRKSSTIFLARCSERLKFK